MENLMRLYRNNMKNREFDKEGAVNLNQAKPQALQPNLHKLGDAGGFKGTGRPTPLKTDSSRCFGMFSLFVFLFFQACVSVPKRDVEKALPPPVSLVHSIEGALKNPAFQEGAWPEENWWEIFQDPLLSSYITTALADSPRMQQAEAKVEVAKQIAKEKRAILFPDLSFNPQTNWQHWSKNGIFRSFAPTFPGTFNDINVTFNSFWDLDLFGKNKQLYYAALGRFHAEEAEKASVRLFLSALVAKTYFELQAHHERYTLLKKTKEKRQTLLGLREARRKEIDNEIRLLVSQENFLKIDQDLLKVQTAMALSEHLLRILMGKSPDGVESLEVSSLPARDVILLPQDLSLDLLARRPDLMAGIWKVEAAAKEIGAAKADFYPNVNLMAFAGFESLHFHNLFSWASRSASLNPAIHLPIFTAGRLRAHLRAKRAEFDGAVADYHEQLLRASKEVLDQISILNFLEEELRIQELTIDNLSQHTELSLQRYEKGIMARMDSLHVEENLLAEELELVNFELEWRQARVNLIKALGGGYHALPPLQPGGTDG